MINTNIPENVKKYIASLFAGDGHVSVKKHGNGARVLVQFGFTYKPIIDKISDILNVGNVIPKKKSEYQIKNFRKQHWRWELTSNDAVRFLEMILPYLPEKGEQSNHAIKFNKWQNKNIGKGRSITRNQILYCEKAIEESKMLKKQIITIEDVEKYDMFKKKHYNPEIESGIQNTLDNFDGDFFIKKENDNNEFKNIISPDINLNTIKNMDNPGFAGFFDAEGSVRITKNIRNVNDTYVLDVIITNSNFPILDKYYKTFGGSLSDPIINKDNHKILWQWSIKSSNALNFLNHIFSYTIEKHEQLNLAIEFQNRRNSGTLTQEKAEYIRHKIMDLHHTEYMIDGNVRILLYHSNNDIKEYKNDDNLNF